MPQNFTKFCEMRFKLCEMHDLFLYKTKLISNFGSFWSEVRYEIWSISNEIQAKANQYSPALKHLGARAIAHFDLPPSRRPFQFQFQGIEKGIADPSSPTKKTPLLIVVRRTRAAAVILQCRVQPAAGRPDLRYPRAGEPTVDSPPA